MVIVMVFVSVGFVASFLLFAWQWLMLWLFLAVVVGFQVLDWYVYHLLFPWSQQPNPRSVWGSGVKIDPTSMEIAYIQLVSSQPRDASPSDIPKPLKQPMAVKGNTICLEVAEVGFRGKNTFYASFCFESH